jgi:hypothetical protein
MRPHLAGTMSVGKPPPPGSFLTGDDTSWIAAAARPLRGLLRWGRCQGCCASSSGAPAPRASGTLGTHERGREKMK